MMTDAIKQPQHYTSHPSGVECREITEHLNSNLANAFKYVFRYRFKQAPVQDLKKAIEYIGFELDQCRDAERILVQPAQAIKIRTLLKQVINHEGLTLVKLFYKHFANVLDKDIAAQSLEKCKSTIEQLITSLSKQNANT